MEETIRNLLSPMISEASGAIKLEGDKLARFKEIFFLEDIGEIYYDNFSLYFTDKETYEKLKHYINGEVVFTFEADEYHTFVCCVRYFSDQMLRDILH